MPAYSRILLPWDSQPQEPVGIDWDNPLTRGLVLAWTPAHIVEPTTGVAWLRGRATKAGGIGLSTDPTASGVYYELPAPSSAAAPLASRLDLSALTVACIAQQPTETNTGRAFVRGHGSGTPAWSIGLNGGSFDGPYASFGATTFGPSSGDATMVGRPHVVSMSGDGATAELWYDGRLFTSGAYTPPTYAYDAANHRTWIVGSNGVGAGAGTENYGAFIWNRPLSADEHRAFHANPWQIFAPRSIWVPVSSESAPATFQAAWARNANTVLVGGRL